MPTTDGRSFVLADVGHTEENNRAEFTAATLSGPTAPAVAGTGLRQPWLFAIGLWGKLDSTTGHIQVYVEAAPDDTDPTKYARVSDTPILDLQGVTPGFCNVPEVNAGSLRFVAEAAADNVGATHITAISMSLERTKIR